MRRLVFVAIGLSARPSQAGRVIVFEAGGTRSAGETVLTGLAKRLPEHQVLGVARPGDWGAIASGTSERVADAVRAANADIGVDTYVSLRGPPRLVILAVDNAGDVVANLSASLRTQRIFRIDELVIMTARAIREEFPAAGPSAAADRDPPPDGRVENMVRWPGVPAGGLASTPTDRPEPVGVAETPSQTDRLLVLAVRGNVGALRLTDRTSTSRRGGTLDINVPLAPAALVGLEARLGDSLHASLTLRHHTTSFAFQPAAGESAIALHTRGLGATGLLGIRDGLGPLVVGLLAGAAYDLSLVSGEGSSAGEPTQLVPSSARILPLAGVSLAYPSPSAAGLSADLALLFTLLGTEREGPVSSGESPSVRGVLAALRVDYAFSAPPPGWFAEVQVLFEYVVAQYQGLGTRHLPERNEALQAARRARSAAGITLGAGYAF